MDLSARFRDLPAAPDLEAKRLREVRRLTPLAKKAQVQLSSLCQIAAEVFRAPIAAISLVDEAEIRIAASHGPEMGTLARDRSLCSCVILRSDSFIVRDVAKELGDLRDLPRPTGYPLRFYAAVPLTTWTCLNVGTLFVADIEPHEVSEGQVDALAELGRLAMLEIERQTPEPRVPLVAADPAENIQNEFVRLLAKGAAHHFGELITGWIATVDALEKELLPGTEEHDLAAQLSRSLIPAARLTDHLKFFTSPLHERADSLPLNQLLESAGKMLQHVVRPGIQIVVKRDRAADGMKVDTRDLELAIAILVCQAAGAMPDGGDVTVSTGVERFEEPYFSRFLELPPALYASITIAHSGVAMKAADRALLTEAGESCGSLESPLALVARIAAQAGGGVELNSAADFGESITIYLPVTWRPIPPDAASIEEGKIHILLVENHDVVLRGVHNALKRRGYRVTTAENGAEALRKFPDAEGFDLVVTDVVMHPVDGVALVEKLREKRPSLLVVFMSGYDKVGVDPRTLPERTRFLAKPFTADALVEQVASLFPDRLTQA